MHKRSDQKPILSISREFYESDSEPWTRCNYGFQDWYHGTGIVPSQHPMKDILSRYESELRCEACSGSAVQVIALQYAVHPASGDTYLDCEFRCDACGAFTAMGRAE